VFAKVFYKLKLMLTNPLLGLYKPVVCKAKNEMQIYKLIGKLKKRIENISSLIEGLCKKKIVFACPLLPFGTVREAYAYCTHLQIAQADTQTKICKRVQFLPTLGGVYYG
jgi:hypothetical protein